MAYNDYAPDALEKLLALCDKKLPGCRPSGIRGNSLHTYGYHRGRNSVPRNDYSVKLSLDKQGPIGACSAMDISFSTKYMKLYTSRLRKSALDPNDSRLECVREFYGTINGSRVFGLTKSGLATSWSSASSDDSHLWHIHFSFFRKFANDYNTVKNVFDVLAGAPLTKKKIVTKKEDTLSAEALNEVLPYASAAGKRLAKNGWGAVSTKTELDYIWETVQKIEVKLGKLDFSDTDKTPAEKAAALRVLLGDDAAAVGKLLGGVA